MAYQLAADLLVLIHFSFIIFVVLGGLLVLRWPWAAIAHLPAAAWGAWIEFTHGVCPLTPLEQSLRRSGGAESYDGSFIDQYIIPIVYPAGFTPEIATILAWGVLALNLPIYALVVIRRNRRRQDENPSA